MLKVTLLGTGSPEPRAHRHGSTHLVEADGDFLLFDCGPTTTQRIAATEVPITEIDYLFFSHHHYDHNVDFAQFALVRWDQGAGTIYPLQVYGPRGTERYVDRLFGTDGVFEPDIVVRTKHPLSLRVYEGRGGVLPRQPIELGASDVQPGAVASGATWKVTAAPALHAQPYHDSLAYRVDCEGGSVVITGDTLPCRTVTELAAGADLLLYMCPGRGEWDDPVGARKAGAGAGTPRGVARSAAEAGVKTLVLVHVGAAFDDPAVAGAAIDQIRSIYDGHVVLGEDLMQLTPAEFTNPPR